MDTWAHMKNNMLIWLSSMSYGLNKLNAQRRGLANYADKKKKNSYLPIQTEVEPYKGQLCAVCYLCVKGRKQVSVCLPVSQTYL